MTGRCPKSGKAAYGNKMAALSAAVLIRRGGGPQMRAYRCVCNRWHLTSRT